MKKIASILFINLLFFTVSSQTNSFSLESAVAFALKNNNLSKNASSDLKIAQAKKWD